MSDTTIVLTAGTRLTPRQWIVEVDDLHSFAELMEQNVPGRNPHVDEEFASRQIFGGLFADGNQLVTKLVHWISDQLPTGAIVDVPTKIRAKFLNPCRPGDDVTFRGEIASVGDDRTISVEGRAETSTGKVVAVIALETRLPFVDLDRARATPGETP